MNTKGSLTGSPELRKRLPYGAIQKLAQKYDVTWQWAHKVVTGKFNGDCRIIRDAHKMAEIEDMRRAEMNHVVSTKEPVLSEA